MPGKHVENYRSMARQRGKKGQGSVYQRKSDGRWCASLKGTVRYAATEAEADKILLQLRAEDAAGQRINNPVTRTVDDLLDEWLDNTVATGRRFKTFASYEQVCRCHIRPALGNVRLRELDTHRVQKFLNQLAAKKPRGKELRQSTIRTIRSVLIAALTQARKWKWVVENVAKDTEVPNALPSKPPPRFEKGQAQALLKAFREAPLGDMFIVSMSLGLRPGEVRGVCVSDITFSKGKPVALTVSHQLQFQQREEDEKSMPRLVAPKTATSHRVLELPEVAADAISRAIIKSGEIWAEQIRRGMITPTRQWAMDNRLIFVTPAGGPVSGGIACKHLKACLAGAGLVHLSQHQLRHLYATYQVDAGAVSIDTVAAVLGHSNPTTTLNFYTRSMKDAQKRAAEATDAMFRDTPLEG